VSTALESFELPDILKTHSDRAKYCRNRAVELIKEATAAPDAETRFELFNRAEKWMMLAFRHRGQEQGGA
jgi:hypothetical protein